MMLRGNLTVSQIPESNMALTIFGIFLGLFLEVSTNGPYGVPRSSWKNHEVSLKEFIEPGVFNYSTLLLNEEKKILYVGAREAIFELNLENIAVRNKQVLWKVPEGKRKECEVKGKSKETECLNYIRVLQMQNTSHLFVCGTHAFQPSCDYLSIQDFKLENRTEDGRGKCSFDPAQSFTSVMVDGDLYSGTVYNFLGSEPIIYRSSTQASLRTEYSISWLNEPSFVHADVIRESKDSADGDDDKVYFFFTEVSVEYEFFVKLSIPRIARVCKGDLGGQRTLQKKWTSFLKAKLVCSMPQLNFVFNIIRDVFILKTSEWENTVIYGLFTSQWGNIGFSAVCAYKISTVDEVFAKGKYMEKAIVEHSQTKWVRYNGVPPSPRPGGCITNKERQQNVTSSLHLPDKTLQFVKDHPLMDDAILPTGHQPQLVMKDVNYTQIVVDQIQALDNNTYDIIFTSTDKGILHKTVIIANEVHIIEEIQLLPHPEPIKTLLLSSGQRRFLYAGSDGRVIQSPTAFCEKYKSCVNCILARDPYCAWSSEDNICVNQVTSRSKRGLLQMLNGDASVCPSVNYDVKYQTIIVQHGTAIRLLCQLNSNLANVVWKKNDIPLTPDPPKYEIVGDSDLLIFNISEHDQGNYSCFSVEQVQNSDFKQLVAAYILSLPREPVLPTSTTPNLEIKTEGNASTAELTLTTAVQSFTTSTTLPVQTEFTLTLSSSATAEPHSMLSTASSEISNLDVKDPSAQPIKFNNNNALLYLFLLFFFLFLILFVYNCHMQYLPLPCLKLRSIILGTKKQPQPEYMACEAGLMEPMVEKAELTETQSPNGHQQKGLRDTGYETEPEYVNGKIPATEDSEESGLSVEKPFDVICESQPIEYADADAPC
ncbi:semaphorin-4D isoform X1 [Polypterus senegalus]|uniref:semaphorin-4D isoform X1 n=2 Tax=Polypterus senegalus TaxID=55291 RepID=UPI0019630312|nr:semaphorin-4D isoform X1 [Polypterus senegalus]